jgi:hypothetical protein
VLVNHRLRTAALVVLSAGLLAGCHTVDAPVIQAAERDRIVGVIQGAYPGATVSHFAGYGAAADSDPPGLSVVVECPTACAGNGAKMARSVVRLIWGTYRGPVEQEVAVTVYTTPPIAGQPARGQASDSAPGVDTAKLSYGVAKPQRPDGFAAEEWH